LTFLEVTKRDKILAALKEYRFRRKLILPRERMYCSSVPQITDHSDGKAVDSTDFLSDGEHVKESLRGVFAYSITGVDHGFTAVGSRSLKHTNTQIISAQKISQIKSSTCVTPFVAKPRRALQGTAHVT